MSIENFNTAPIEPPATDATVQLSLSSDAMPLPPNTPRASDALQQYFARTDSSYQQLSMQDSQSYNHIAQSVGKENHRLVRTYMAAVQSKVELQLAGTDWNTYGNAHNGETLKGKVGEQYQKFTKADQATKKPLNDELAKLRTQLVSTAQKNGVTDVNDKYLQNFENTRFNEAKRSQELLAQLGTSGADASAKPPIVQTAAGESSAVIPMDRPHHPHVGGHHVVHHREHHVSQGAQNGSGKEETADELNREELARAQGVNTPEVQQPVTSTTPIPPVTPAPEVAVPPPVVPGAADPWRANLAAWEIGRFGREVYANVTNDQQRWQLDEAWYARSGNRAVGYNATGTYPYNYSTEAYANPYNYNRYSYGGYNAGLYANPYSYNTGAYAYNYNTAPYGYGGYNTGMYSYPGAYYPGVYSPLGLGISVGGWGSYYRRPVSWARPGGFSIGVIL